MKPRLLYSRGRWRCVDHTYAGYGRTPALAYAHYMRTRFIGVPSRIARLRKPHITPYTDNRGKLWYCRGGGVTVAHASPSKAFTHWCNMRRIDLAKLARERKTEQEMRMVRRLMQPVQGQA